MDSWPSPSRSSRRRTVYAFVTGLAFSAFTAVVLDAMGHGAGATKYNVFASLANFPIWWVGLALGVAAERWGARNMLFTEATFGVMGVGVFLSVLLRVRRSSLAEGDRHGTRGSVVLDRRSACWKKASVIESLRSDDRGI
jgi:hypothetical protein